MTRQYKKIRLSLAFLVGLVLTFSIPLSAAQLYRFKDENGKTVMGRTIPPHLVGNGYEVLNEKGRVIEVVSPALTPEQIAARDAEEARQKKLAEERARQAERDAELRQLYSHPDDAVRIMERKANDILNLMQAKQGQIEFSQKQIVDLEQRAADIQRKGMSVPERYEAQIGALKKDIENARNDIVERSEDFDVLLKDFDEIIRRLELITKRKAQSYSGVLEKLLEIKQKVKLDN